jgi:DNA gyrase/topoisomerase IV subunit B
MKKAFQNVSVHSKDESINLTGVDLLDFLESLKDLKQGLNDLEKQDKIPRECSEFLLMKDESFYHRDFSDKEKMQELRTWLEKFKWTVRSQSSDEKGENWLEINLKAGNKKFDKQFFENPLLHRCFIAYPKVKHFVENKSYFVIKNKREIGKDLPWYKVVELLDKAPDTSGVVLQRYKGLGEMSAEQLWETTMNPATRTLLTVSIDDAAKADQIFHMLMGGEVPPRKAFIQAHAKSVRNLDI